MNAIFLYVLALAARRHRVTIHAFCVLSNHVHLVVADVEGLLPAFMRDLNSLVARAVNASLGDSRTSGRETVAPTRPSSPSLPLMFSARLRTCSRVAAGLVKHGAEWPGLWVAPEKIGAAKLTARRPEQFIDPKGYLPELVELEVAVPPGFPSADEFRVRLADEVHALEETHQREIPSQGRRFLGVARVLAQSPFARPAPGEPRFQLNPRIAARDKWRRIEGLFRMKDFEKTYREARVSWCAGMRDVVFPAGTYLMRIMYGVQLRRRRLGGGRAQTPQACGQLSARVAQVCFEGGTNGLGAGGAYC